MHHLIRHAAYLKFALTVEEAGGDADPGGHTILAPAAAIHYLMSTPKLALAMSPPATSAPLAPPSAGHDAAASGGIARRRPPVRLPPNRRPVDARNRYGAEGEAGNV